MESRSIVVTTDYKWEEGDGLVREMNPRTVNPKKMQGNKVVAAHHALAGNRWS
jgi:hypothetical protein